jgi:hypothetical protein
VTLRTSDELWQRVLAYSQRTQTPVADILRLGLAMVVDARPTSARSGKGK